MTTNLKSSEPVCPADLAVAFTGLIQAFRTVLPNRSLTESEVMAFITLPARVLVNLGWLREVTSGRFTKEYYPAGPVLDELNGSPQSNGSPQHDESSGSGAEQSALPPLTGVAPEPAAPVPSISEAGSERGEGRGPTGELAQMIETLRIVSEETRDGWLRMALAQQNLGWPEREPFEQGTAHLRRLASDLYNALADAEYQLGLMTLNQRKSKIA